MFSEAICLFFFYRLSKSYFRDSAKCFDWETENNNNNTTQNKTTQTNNNKRDEAFPAVALGPKRDPEPGEPRAAHSPPPAASGRAPRPGRSEPEGSRQGLLGFLAGPERQHSFGGTLLWFCSGRGNGRSNSRAIQNPIHLTNLEIWGSSKLRFPRSQSPSLSPLPGPRGSWPRGCAFR